MDNVGMILERIAAVAEMAKQADVAEMAARQSGQQNERLPGGATRGLMFRELRDDALARWDALLSVLSHTEPASPDDAISVLLIASSRLKFDPSATDIAEARATIMGVIAMLDAGGARAHPAVARHYWMGRGYCASPNHDVKVAV